MPVLQREGHTRYALTAGEYRSGNDQQEEPKFFQSTVLHGLPAGWTLYGGTQLANRYRAFNLGVGKKIWAISAPCRWMSPGPMPPYPTTAIIRGQSIRFLYNKSLSDVGTNIQLVGYRYSTKGYYSFADTTYRRMSGYDVETRGWRNPGEAEIHRLLQPRLQQARQSAAKRHSTVGAYRHALSERQPSDLLVNRQGGPATAGRAQRGGGRHQLDAELQPDQKNARQQGRDQMLAVNVNIPFSHWLRSDSKSVWRHASASYSMSHDLDGRMTNLAGLLRHPAGRQ